MTVQSIAFGRVDRSRATTRLLAMAAAMLLAISMASPAAANGDDAVLQWNDATLRAIRTAGTAGVFQSRLLAIVHAAIFDAVNGIERRYTPIHVAPDGPRGASVRAAAAQAGHTALSGLFPTQNFDADLQAALDAIAADAAQDNSTSIARGRAWGEHVALQILAWRAADGLNPPPAMPFTGSNGVGEWRPTPPNFSPMVAENMATTEPFVIESPDAFRPLVGPPSLTSQDYTDNFNEVKELGQNTSATRTTDQTDSARFWFGAAASVWNRAAADASRDRHLTLSENARLFMLLNVAQADAIISCWDAKIAFNFWRPVTAIQLADTDGNPDTDVDATWLPLIATPAYPDFDSGNQSVGRSSATVLIAYFGDSSPVDSFSESLPGVTRHFANFTALADDAFGARIWSGIHFRFAMESARERATLIAEYVLANAAQRVHGNAK